MFAIVEWLYNAVLSMVSAVFDWLLGLVQAAWFWLVELLAELFGQVWMAIKGLVPIGVTQFFSDFDLSAFAGYLTDVSWILPVVPAIAIFTTAIGLCATIRMCRWIKSCIPTISGA